MLFEKPVYNKNSSKDTALIYITVLRRRSRYVSIYYSNKTTIHLVTFNKFKKIKKHPARGVLLVRTYSIAEIAELLGLLVYRQRVLLFSA